MAVSAEVRARQARSTKRAKSARWVEVRTNREARRDEISARWNRRVAIRLLEERDYLDVPDLLAQVTDDVIILGRWAERADLAHIAITRHGIDPLEFIAHLVRIIQLKEMPYDQYLLTEEWKERAARAKKKYGSRCALDAKHDAIDAHHRTYERRGREFADDLLPLCRECHDAFHKKNGRP